MMDISYLHRMRLSMLRQLDEGGYKEIEDIASQHVDMYSCLLEIKSKLQIDLLEHHWLFDLLYPKIYQLVSERRKSV